MYSTATVRSPILAASPLPPSRNRCIHPFRTSRMRSTGVSTHEYFKGRFTRTVDLLSLLTSACSLVVSSNWTLYVGRSNLFALPLPHTLAASLSLSACTSSIVFRVIDQHTECDVVSAMKTVLRSKTSSVLPRNDSMIWKIQCPRDGMLWHMIVW